MTNDKKRECGQGYEAQATLDEYKKERKGL